MDCFKLAISLPTQITHKVHTESYKKLFILSLIHDGKVPTLPSNTSSMLKMRIEMSFIHYKSLGQAYMQK